MEQQHKATPDNSESWPGMEELEFKGMAGGKEN